MGNNGTRQEAASKVWPVNDEPAYDPPTTGRTTGKQDTSGSARLLFGGVILVCLLATSFLLPTKEILTAALQWTESLGLWGPLLLAVFYIVACVLFLPGSLLTLGAGAIFGLGWGYLAVSVGSVLGASLAFVLGRTIGRGWIEGKVVRNERFRAIDEAVGREGFKIVLLTRLSPVFPFNLLNYAYGVTRVSFRDYFLASWLGMIPGTLMYVYLGSAAKSMAELATGNVRGGALQTALFFVGLVATVAVTVLVTRVARKALTDAIDKN
jgi:uncharacterized membrane protein YdjX (TVP38/TMEM64 family)